MPYRVSERTEEVYCNGVVCLAWRFVGNSSVYMHYNASYIISFAHNLACCNGMAQCGVVSMQDG